MKDIGIYVHIPFCVSKCYYCDFRSTKGSDNERKEYIEYLLKEIKLYKDDLKDRAISTVFIGGGTPSILDGKLIKDLLDEIKSIYILKDDCEITIECNPGTLSLEKLLIYKEAGINRLSIGLQTYNDDELKAIGRIHNILEFEESIYNARKVGFDNINVDVIYGIPGQDIDSLKTTLNRLTELNIEHVSAYSLKIEEGTKFYDMYEESQIKPISDEMDREMYYLVRDILKENDIFQYEISNFSKDNHQSRHNKIYWLNREYIGLGLAAHSFFKNQRYSNFYSFDDYYSAIDKCEKPIDMIEEKTKEDQIVESIFLGLRLSKGLCIKEINKRFNISILDMYKEKLDDLENKGLIEVKQGYIRLTSYGMDISNSVFIEFL